MEVPSPINLKQLDDARAWAANVMERRPYRTDIFREFASQLLTHKATSVLELGSGPGFLAKHILDTIPDIRYTAYDFSDAMHLLAKERLGVTAVRVKFVTGSFLEQNWERGLGQFDALVSLQAVHEVRHKNRVLSLFLRAKKLINKGGIFLYCDHFYGEGGMQNPHLYLSTPEQEQCLTQAGFSDIRKLLTMGSLNLWLAGNNSR